MLKNWLLVMVSMLVALLLALGLLRWLAPGLLGAPVDMRLVQSTEKLPPYFQVVFGLQGDEVDGFLLEDPLTRLRGKPLFPADAAFGTHDLLGFRNRAVPRVADVVVIGDSQTYGNNAVLSNNWPTRMAASLKKAINGVYSMALGGWGAIQYLYMFDKAAVFQPRVVLVAFYAGNDPLDSFHMAYGLDEWTWLRPDTQIGPGDAPPVAFPAPRDQWWEVAFADGVKTLFTPTLRLASNSEHPVVKAGWGVMANVIREIASRSRDAGIKVLFTVVPTKETVYAEKVARSGLQPPADYQTLVKNETENIAWLRKIATGEENAGFIDLLSPLQKAAMEAKALYPEDINGHPVAAGYDVIGEFMADAIAKYLPEPPAEGFAVIQRGEGKYTPVLLRAGGLWYFGSNEAISENGWNGRKPAVLQPRDAAGMPLLGVINEVDPVRFGPL
jgi:hypothetical protein